MVKDIDLGRLFELSTTNKRYVNALNLQEIENETLLDCKGEFELIGSMLIGDIEQKTNNRFKIIDDFENYKIAIDVDYNCEDVIFKDGCLN